MDASKVKATTIAISAMIAALYLGITVATNQLEITIWLVSGAILVTCLTLGRRVYLILPIAISINLALPLPGNFSSGLIAQGLFIAFAILLFLTRKLPFEFKFTELEFWALLLISSVVQAYFRNPVGLNIFGADSVGAKPYAIVAVSAVAAAILSTWIVGAKDLKFWIQLSLLGSILNFGVAIIGLLFPQAAYYLAATHGANLSETETSVDSRATRIGFLRGISYALATWISSHRNPLIACLNPLIAPFILFALAASAFSGYRSAVIYVGLIFFAGVCYRGGLRSVFAALLALITGLMLLTISHSLAPLPINIQRSLTFLPGKWDPSLKQESQQSTDWRVEMWKEALFTERWIQNKVLGDGLGFTRQELETMQDSKIQQLNAISRSGLTYQQESFMISGGYHSGPVQTIRTTGYVGLAVLLFTMLRVAVHAHRQIQRCQNTEWLPVAMFIGLPLVVLPVYWTFVFGTFNDGIAEVLLGAALVRLLERNLPLPVYAHRERLPALVSLPPQSRRRPAAALVPTRRA